MSIAAPQKWCVKSHWNLPNGCVMTCAGLVSLTSNKGGCLITSLIGCAFQQLMAVGFPPFGAIWAWRPNNQLPPNHQLPDSNTDFCYIFSRSAIYPKEGSKYNMSYSQSLGELISQVRNALMNLELGFIMRNQEECKRMTQLVVKECKEIEKAVDEYFNNNIQ